MQRQAQSRLELGPRLHQMLDLLRDIAVKAMSVHYDGATEVALFRFVLSGTLLPAGTRHQILQLAGTHVAVLEPARLLGPVRDRFYERHLPRYRTLAADVSTLDEALSVFHTAVDDPPGEESVAEPIPNPAAVSFRYGHQWYRGRISRLGLDRVDIVTSLPPRNSVAIKIAFSWSPGPETDVTSAIVVKSTSASARPALSMPGFCARLVTRTAADLQRLREHLARLRRYESEIALPPQRQDIRFPFQCPVVLARDQQQLNGHTLDVSRRGMFVETDLDALSEQAVGKAVFVQVQLEGSDAPAKLPARVARVVSAATAKSRGLSPGVGLELLEVADETRMLFEAFVERVGERVKRTLS